MFRPTCFALSMQSLRNWSTNLELTPSASFVSEIKAGLASTGFLLKKKRVTSAETNQRVVETSHSYSTWKLLRFAARIGLLTYANDTGVSQGRSPSRISSVARLSRVRTSSSEGAPHDSNKSSTLAKIRPFLGRFYPWSIGQTKKVNSATQVNFSLVSCGRLTEAVLSTTIGWEGVSLVSNGTIV